MITHLYHYYTLKELLMSFVLLTYIVTKYLTCARTHRYAATKGAVLTMTTSLATDHVHEGIRCNCICPGRVHTPFVDAFIKKNYAGNEKKMFKQLSEYMPQGRMLTPGEVAALALYLCSDEARMITGAAITIDGGITAKP